MLRLNSYVKLVPELIEGYDLSASAVYKIIARAQVFTPPFGEKEFAYGLEDPEGNRLVKDNHLWLVKIKGLIPVSAPKRKRMKKVPA